MSYDFNSKILPLIDIVWVNDKWYGKAMHRLFTLNSKQLSLVDCLSFEIMEILQIDIAFAFDRHFETNGFTLADFHSRDEKS